ncbi:hypothetical protein [Fimbriiglobus ruber]|uniref:Uncharacterized protein n=1 Tax=Fimbriiglobus ruber TaxID=1908690 RepID=A0A225DDI4_9BACT|nr:hypothetical protein [Fimbriiglobus ruber]OWK35209.1 hypothetical protein FRUB_10051 [Fimbriiglobus ruber]
MTTEMKATAGPWEIKKSAIEIEQSDYVIISKGGREGNYYIAAVSSQNGEGKTEANAHLIAEAGTIATDTGLTPRQLAEQREELLEALEDICTQLPADKYAFDSQRKSLKKARAAIARARGENAEPAV